MIRLKLFANDYFYDPTFQMKIIKRDPELPYPLHSHDFYELVFIVSGKGIHFTSENELTLRPGNLFVIVPGMEHGYKDVQDLVLYNILFGRRLFKDRFFDLTDMPGYQALFTIEPMYRNDTRFSSMLRLTPAQIADLLPLVERMLAESDSTDYNNGAKSIAFAYLMQFLVTIFRIYEETPRGDNQMILRLADVFSYIESHTDQPITTEELMEVANMSASTLNRYFQKCTGLSPVEFHTHKRIELACKLIRTTPLSMAAIADATGFSDPNYFSRQFRKVMEMSPKEYKEDRTSWYR
jgi:AraC family L-rhamnose operon transcriptional activator RhaR/AraC family L-rhamnose operon regulatory protein RhaS